MSFRPPLWIPDGRPIMLGHTNGECHSCASIAAQTRFWTRRATDPTVGGDLFQLTEGGKLGLGVDPSIARRKVELLAEFDVVAPEVPDILAAIDLHRLHGFSFWDRYGAAGRQTGWMRGAFLRR